MLVIMASHLSFPVGARPPREPGVRKCSPDISGYDPAAGDPGDQASAPSRDAGTGSRL